MYLFVVELKTALLLFATQYVDRLKITRFDAVGSVGFSAAFASEKSQ